MTCENSPSSPEPAADCSEASSSDGEQLPLLRTTPIASESSVRGAATWPTPTKGDSWNPSTPQSAEREWGKHNLRGLTASPSTPTCAPSTPSPDRATSSPAGFPASRTVRQASASAALTPETSGLTPFAYCEKVTLPSGSSRTYPVSSQAEMLMDEACSAASLVTFPKRGSMRNGVCWERTMSVPRTGASGCGYWPSPTAVSRECNPEQWEERREDQGGTLRSTYLQDAVKYQVEARGGATRQTWGTPTSRDHKDTGTMENVPENALLGRQVLNESQTTGSLNPEWVEWLQMFPRGWTDCEHSVTPSALARWLRRSRSWLAKLGYLSE